MRLVLAFFVILSSLFSLAQPASADSGNVHLHVDIRDMLKTEKPGFSSIAESLHSAMLNYPDKFFPQGVRYSAKGAGFDKSTRDNVVFGVEFESVSGPIGYGSYQAKVIAFINSEEDYYFQRYSVEFNGEDFALEEIHVTEKIPLAYTKFSVQIGQEQLKVVLEDENYGIKKVYPVGMGGFHEGTQTPGESSLLTPQFYRGHLTKEESWFTIHERWKPSYFSGRPFIRIANSQGSPTAIGLHYKMTEPLMRGYVSHGCIRVRDKDLYELFYILTEGPLEKMPLVLSRNLLDSTEHPYQKKHAYKRVINYGTEDHPETRRGKDGLLIMEWVYGKYYPISWH